jgi:hypothetical protein
VEGAPASCGSKTCSRLLGTTEKMVCRRVTSCNLYILKYGPLVCATRDKDPSEKKNVK